VVTKQGASGGGKSIDGRAATPTPVGLSDWGNASEAPHGSEATSARRGITSRPIRLAWEDKRKDKVESEVRHGGEVHESHAVRHLTTSAPIAEFQRTDFAIGRLGFDPNGRIPRLSTDEMLVESDGKRFGEMVGIADSQRLAMGGSEMQSLASRSIPVRVTWDRQRASNASSGGSMDSFLVADESAGYQGSHRFDIVGAADRDADLDLGQGSPARPVRSGAARHMSDDVVRMEQGVR